MKLTMSIPKVEKVVKPPQSPMIQNARKDSAFAEFSENLTSNPIKNAPPKLTTRVGQGRKDFIRMPTNARKTEPQEPPAATKRKNLIPMGEESFRKKGWSLGLFPGLGVSVNLVLILHFLHLLVIRFLDLRFLQRIEA